MHSGKQILVCDGIKNMINLYTEKGNAEILEGDNFLYFLDLSLKHGPCFLSMPLIVLNESPEWSVWFQIVQCDSLYADTVIKRLF